MVSKCWEDWSKEIAQNLERDGNYDNFLNWPIIKCTMFVEKPPYVNMEYDFIKDKVPPELLIEDKFGNPPRHPNYPESSGNLIHHLYHVSKFEEATGTKFTDYRLIFEFGAGYGSMCRIAKRMGFVGHYLIYDLPELEKIQDVYLDNTSSFHTHINRSHITNGPAHRVLGKRLFISTWALNEAPLETMDYVLKNVSDFDGFLIAFDNDFVNGNNFEYFTKFTESVKNIAWKFEVMNHIPGSYYFFGKKNNV